MITIVLPLLGRVAFTHRFINYAIGLGYPIIVADGAPTPQSGLPREVEYHYCGPDRSFSDYWRKMAYALQLVRSPYVMVCDNDDFPLRTIANSAEFLEANPDYVCHTGRIRGFWLWPWRTFGPLSAITKQYAPYDTPADYNEDDVSARVIRGFANSWSYYAVYRTEVLRDIWKTVAELDFKDMQVHEKFMAMETLVKGKAKCDPSFTSYLRQYGTGLNYPRIAQRPMEMEIVLFLMAASGVDRQALQEAWIDWYHKWHRRNHGLWPRLRHRAKVNFPSLAEFVQGHRYVFWQRPIWDILNERHPLHRLPKSRINLLAQVDASPSGDPA